MRLALDSIAEFCYKIHKITNKKIVFILTYDATINNEVLINFFNQKDYYEGVENIYNYCERLNNKSFQIKAYDMIGDYGKCMKIEFQDSKLLAEEHKVRMDELGSLLLTAEGKEKLCNRCKELSEYFNIKTPNKEELEIEKKWIENNLKFFPQTTYTVDELANSLTICTTIFKKMDEKVRKETEKKYGRKILRLSPHEKTEAEKTKFGFSFFPNTNILSEPWMGNSAVCDLCYSEPQPKILEKKVLRQKTMEETYRDILSNIDKKVNKLEEQIKILKKLAEKVKESEEKVKKSEIKLEYLKNISYFINYKKNPSGTKKEEKSATSKTEEKATKVEDNTQQKQEEQIQEDSKKIATKDERMQFVIKTLQRIRAERKRGKIINGEERKKMNDELEKLFGAINWFEDIKKGFDELNNFSSLKL